MPGEPWAIGVDLGGTKVEVAQVTGSGRVARRVRRPTEAERGSQGIVETIADAVRELEQDAAGGAPGIGVGVAGQVQAGTGLVESAPNLNWENVPLARLLGEAVDRPVRVVNDVRAAAWGEWLHGAGRGCDDLVCVFVGTGVGGGVVTGGRMLAGQGNAAGELGHVTVRIGGPPCHCRNRGCLESLAGGWAIARDARAAVKADPAAGEAIVAEAEGDADRVTAAHVSRAASAGDPLALRLSEAALEALVAGMVGLVNIFDPARLILGGGVIEGFPGWVDRVREAVSERALEAALRGLEVTRAALGGDAGVVGSAALAMGAFGTKGDG